MEPSIGEFNFVRIESVLYGPGKIEMLGRELDRRGAKRALIVTTKTLARSKLIDRVKAAAGPAFAGIFSETQQHAPMGTISALIAEARRVKADSFKSRSANSWLLGKRLRGKVTLTMAAGRVAYAA